MLSDNNNDVINNLPEEIRVLVEDQDYTVDNVGQSGSSILMFSDKVLKIQPETEETRSECAVLKWLEDKIPVPRVLAQVSADGMSYLLMTKMQGKMSCDEELMESPDMVVSALAQGLQRLWEVDITDCPARWDLDVKLAIAKENVEQGLVDVEDAEPETFGENGFAGPRELLNWLLANRPEEEPVLAHGDFCMPNVFIEEGKPVGYIDCGRMGIADKWQDIALCYRSLKHNYAGVYTGKVYEDFRPELLFEKLGIEPDWEKIRYYILVDELF